MSDFDYSGGKFKPLDGSLCLYGKCGDAPASSDDVLCSKHRAGCRCDDPSHMLGEGCNDALDAEGVCSVCAKECHP